MYRPSGRRVIGEEVQQVVKSIGIELASKQVTWSPHSIPYTRD